MDEWRLVVVELDADAEIAGATAARAPRRQGGVTRSSSSCLLV
jgi:hypothetical protein